MSDKRFSDEDARRSLALAAEAETTAPTAATEGWTLAELQRAGVEAGIAPSSITAAALLLERASPADGRYFGMPVAVARAVPLARAMTDEDWDRLVARLRETFQAEGRERVHGARREWRVGNLRVTHEPTAEGALLDLRTRKGNARLLVRAGTTMLVAASAGGALAATATQGFEGFGLAAILGGTGLAMLLGGVLRLPGWASARARQFESLADYARRMVGP